MGLYPRHLTDFLIQQGIPFGRNSNVYVVDPVNGDDDNSGSLENPLESPIEAEDRCVANQHDVVLMLAGSTGATLGAQLLWDKSYTHLVGWAAPSMTAQRARIHNETVTGVTPLVNITGSGCIFKNVYIFQGVAEAVANINIQVSGGRNYFENVHFAGGGNAAQAIDGGASLRIVGSEGENLFKNCTIGVDTIAQATGMRCLAITGGTPRNVFRDCHFITYAGATSAMFVEWETLSAVDRYMLFERCAFINTGTSTIASSFVMPAAAPAHRRVLLIDCWSYGATLWDVSDRGYIYGNMQNTDFGGDGGGVMLVMHT